MSGPLWLPHEHNSIYVVPFRNWYQKPSSGAHRAPPSLVHKAWDCATRALQRDFFPVPASAAREMPVQQELWRACMPEVRRNRRKWEFLEVTLKILFITQSAGHHLFTDFTVPVSWPCYDVFCSCPYQLVTTIFSLLPFSLCLALPYGHTLSYPPYNFNFNLPLHIPGDIFFFLFF